MSATDDELLDSDLHEEITLVGDVVAAVAGLEGPLDEAEIDRALGVGDDGAGLDGDADHDESRGCSQGSSRAS